MAASDAVAEILGNQWGCSTASYTHAEGQQTQVSLYLPERPANWRRRRAALVAALQSLEKAGLPVGSGRILLRRLPRENWAESWKRHFHPIEITRRLLIRPSWSRQRARAGQAVIELDPGLSFGTGHHPTTAFCLKQLVTRRLSGVSQSLLDLGTGSGILAIAAARLGYEPVRAIDFDGEAIRVAQRNAQKNGVRRRVLFSHADIARLPHEPAQKYSVICANLVAPLLLENIGPILEHLEPDGVVLLAGILKTEFGAVRSGYEAAGLRLLTVSRQMEWASGVFQRRRSI
jgi:ribosomal protein L11 methyltransferase